MGIGAVLLALVLGGCGTITPSNAVQAIIPIYNNTTHKKMSTVPASLGFMVPQVANYHCGGNYMPAQRVKATPTTPPSEVGPPFWQLTVICIDPHLKFNLPKGTMRAGMVWIFEMPSNSTSLLKAIQFLHPTADLKISSVDNLPIGIGQVDFGLNENNLVWVLGGKTTWIGDGQKNTEKVIVYLTGRAVPVSVLKEFAKSLHPLSSGS